MCFEKFTAVALQRMDCRGARVKAVGQEEVIAVIQKEDGGALHQFNSIHRASVTSMRV